ncbi:hypothetical protein [Spongiibacter sp.]|uniref:hypothetical protein n=1 Tax=Spongiibacter sp. TaxID=2024860 RepID=UPI00257CB260|nr:hypothetical protein [Spongiibacter sp.]
MKKLRIALCVATLLASTGMWLGYAFEYTSVLLGRQLALAIVWWERSPELLRLEISSALDEDRLEDARALIKMNEAYGYPHRPEWDEEVARKSTFLYAAKRAPKEVYRGVAYGEMTSAVSASAAITSDFFVIGDFRDLAMQGYQVSQGEEMDKLVAGLAAFGIVTSFGAPILDGGVSLAKAAARQTARQSAGFGKLLSARVVSAVDYAELSVALKQAEFSPTGAKLLSGKVRRSLRFEKISDFFSDLGAIVRNSGGISNALVMTKYISDTDTLKSVRRATAGFGEKTVLVVRIGGERVIKVFGRLFQKLLWLIGAIFTGLLTLLQLLLIFILGRSGSSGKSSLVTSP